MKELKRINSTYRNALLFDGFYKEGHVKYNKFRYRFNLLMSLASFLFFLFHLLIFITDNEKLKKELIYFHLSDDFGSKYLNFGKFFK